MVNETEASFKSELDTRYLKSGATTMLIPLSPKTAQLIGFVAAQWGAFEVRMDAMIEGFHTAMFEVPPANWKRLAFRDRKKLFKDSYRRYFPRVGWQEDIAHFDKATNVAAGLHWRRNVVVHGSYRYWADPKEGDTAGVGITAFGIHKGREVSLDLTEDALSRLFHDIAHVNGALMHRLAARGVSLDNPEQLVKDDWFLQGQESGSFELIHIPSRP